MKRLPADSPASVRARLTLVMGRDDLRLSSNQHAVERVRKAYALPDRNDVEATFHLAVAHLRLAEAENRLVHRDPKSCICRSKEEEFTANRRAQATRTAT